MVQAYQVGGAYTTPLQTNSYRGSIITLPGNDDNGEKLQLLLVWQTL